MGTLNCCVKSFIKHSFLTATRAKWFTRSLVRCVHHRLETDTACHTIFSKTTSRRFGLRECLRSLCTFHRNDGSTNTDSLRLNHTEVKTLKRHQAETYVKLTVRKTLRQLEPAGQDTVTLESQEPVPI